jgi:hypothetical protein
MLYLLLGAAITAVLVSRAISVALVYAIPGLAFAALAILRRARAHPRLISRVGLTVLALFMAPTWSAVVADMAAQEISPQKKVPRAVRSGTINCQKRAAFAPMTKLAPTRVFAQIDMASHLLLYSQHSVIATPHHRNDKAMAVVYRGFLSPADEAEEIVRASGATHLLICGNSGESNQTVRRAPKGLAADLRVGKVPGWLTPLYRDKGSQLMVFAVTPD